MRKNRKITVVDETDDGVYVWYTDDGKLVQDSDGNVMNIVSKRGDKRQIDKLKAAARYYGVEGGAAVFMAGSRPIDDQEYENQKARQLMGLIPDIWDIPAMKDEMKFAEKRYREGKQS